VADVSQHIASTGPNLDILQDFLEQGASVHLRNHEGHTPLFLAAHAGLEKHVVLLRNAGAHLTPEEMKEAEAEMQAGNKKDCWVIAIKEDS